MRQLFSSPRIENVEAVARMLEEAGIEIRISNGRSYRGAIRGNFSYRDDGGGAPRPAVWVIRADQQPEARRILREAGLLRDAPIRGESFLPPPATLAGGDRGLLAARGGGRFRYGMLLAVGVMAALVMLAWRAAHRDGGEAQGLAGAASTTQTAAPRDTAAAAPLPGMPEVASLPTEAFVVATPPALAATLLRDELAAAGTRRGCLAIDGADPNPALLQALAAEGLDVAPASACPEGALALSVAAWTTDGSGSGTVQLAVGDADAREVAARREGRDWRLDATD
ncbi:putative signal transducing protein [Luteimonas arsenica]|uniref:putative signal transducing protein n=1 Tax=Luteimonas arsenica TaxID=1586242 RepID=UPI00105629AE|nr:DUF2007 domain-containing protein [Luteimonas arsenica]